MQSKATLIDFDTKEILDFFIFHAENHRNFERAMEILKTRPIVREDKYVADFATGYGGASEKKRVSLEIEPVKWKIIGQDHAAIAVWNAERWARKYENLGARVECITEDSNPEDPSSMKLWKVNWGNLRIALIEPISRLETSQVEDFLNMHGDHSFQHIAIGVTNLVEFVSDMRKIGANFVGEILEREDPFGPLKQIFGCIFDEELCPTTGQFYEFVERPTGEGNAFADDGKKSQEFSPWAARILFQNLRTAAGEKDKRTFF